ncbi:carbohydrate binding domain-containing protein [Agarivorans sp. Alg241-V36]|uniref:carbohydrate binding domain-containing protein n=1 Tax=Agarivorans sp. Alg241-V36 TaxID=2305992 RepID=UPI0013D2C5F2|nr:carbohydrate binding domain-containing protein [Agarivorans sp. Alg241-V36]
MKTLFKKAKQISAGLALAVIAAAVSSTVHAIETVDLMILYSKELQTAQKGSAEAYVKNFVANANNAYKTSNIDIQLRLVHLQEFNFEGGEKATQSSFYTFQNNSEVRSMRAKYGADLVSYVSVFGNGICGKADLPFGNGKGRLENSRNEVFSIVANYPCGAMTFAHELGHNMGLYHSRRQSGVGVAYDFGLGHGVDYQFATLMSYPTYFGITTRVNRFSNPEQTCPGGSPCGSAHANEDSADAAYAVNSVADQLSGYMPTVVDQGIDVGDGDNGGGQVCNAPSTPRQLTASNIDVSSYTLSWGAVTGASEYQVQRKAASTSNWVNYQSTSSTSLTISGEQGDEAYARVIAKSDCGKQSAASTTLTTQLKVDIGNPGTGGPGECTSLTTPNKPVASNVTNSSFTLSWTAVNGADSYQVQLWNGSNSTWINKQEVTGASINVTGVTAQTSYYRVIAKKACGTQSTASQWISVELSADTGPGDQCDIPAAPAKPVASKVTSNSYTLTWAPAANSESYQVQHWDSDASSWSNFTKTSSTTANITNVTEPVSNARVIGINSCGTLGEASEAVYVQMETSTPGNPGNGGGNGEANLIENGDFESGNVQYWQGGYYGDIRSSTTSHSGSYSLKVRQRTNWYDGAMQNITNRITSGGTYDFSAWIRMNSGSAELQMLIYYTAGGVSQWSDSIKVNVGNNWTQMKGSVPLSAAQGSITKAELYILGENSRTPTTPFYVDDVTFSKR